MCGAMMAGFGGQSGYGIALLIGTAAALLLAVVVAGMLLAARRPHPAPRPAIEHPAIAVLKERLARGEIDPEEFERRLFTLLMHDPPH
jgi:uncharacterized membrane protein